MVLAAVLLVGLGAPVASAATSPSPGVHIDPGSPVAKEYAIPLAQARGGGSNGGLFGRGITRARAHRTPPPSHPTAASVTPAASSTTIPAPTVISTPATRRASRRTPARRARRHRAASPRATPPAVAPAPASEGVPAVSYTRTVSAGTGLAWMLGVAALVLALGGLGGAALARYGRRTSARTS